MPLQAKIIKHSIVDGIKDSDLMTVEVEFHRFILPELNTHRLFSRNYQSSRAIPVERQIQLIKEDPAIPVFWGKNQPGMQSYEELEYEVRKTAIEQWGFACDDATSTEQ